MNQSGKIRNIELLAPAKNLEIGKEAIIHGADAVYIGAPQFSARAAAAVSVEDISELISFAHRFRAKVYVALNTVLSDDELGDAEKLVHILYRLGADALIIQDFAFFDLDLPPIPLHASTQMDNRTIEKVQLLENLGCEQIVLARELSLTEIRSIAEVSTSSLEVFVHGALCVSYSGQCYISQSYCKRSANRGVCAQFCRLPYSLVDANGKLLLKDKHLLSLKDLNRSSDLEALLDAGVSSFKIEGRLKDLSYVKNVTAYYRRALDLIFERRSSEFRRSSDGISELFFDPNLRKSFNRGFIHYFLNNKEENIISKDTPKSKGEKVGVVDKVTPNYFTLKTSHNFNNGDGFCYLNGRGNFEGFRLNKIENFRFYPLGKTNLRPGIALYRNYDKFFEDLLLKNSAERYIFVIMQLRKYKHGVVLDVMDEKGNAVSLAREITKEKAKTDQEELQFRVLSKLGNTIFKVKEINIIDCRDIFLPSSFLSDIRRDALLLFERSLTIRRPLSLRNRSYNKILIKDKELDYKANIMNSYASRFYQKHGVRTIEPAFELKEKSRVPLMFTKYCVLYELGKCKKTNPKEKHLSEPLYLLHKYGKLRIETDCRLCEMRLYRED
ncbi:MAG: U32 family peptidase [Bacteroidales bacterium]|nr:U32 family peptidase [Bacteroidales bacterium]